MDVITTKIDEDGPPFIPVDVIEPSKDDLYVKEGDNIIFQSNDKRWWFGVAKKNGYFTLYSIWIIYYCLVK